MGKKEVTVLVDENGNKIFSSGERYLDAESVAGDKTTLTVSSAGEEKKYRAYIPSGPCQDAIFFNPDGDDALTGKRALRPDNFNEGDQITIE